LAPFREQKKTPAVESAGARNLYEKGNSRIF